MDLKEWVILLITVLPLSWCNTCLQGLPPFLNTRTVRGFLSDSSIRTRYDVLLPSYNFTQSGRIARWDAFLTRVPVNFEPLRITFSIWRLESSQSCYTRNHLYCMVDENSINADSNDVFNENRLLQFHVPSSERFMIRQGDIVGISVRAPDDLDLLFDRDVDTNIILQNDYSPSGPGEFNHPAPLINVQLENNPCTVPITTVPIITTTLAPTTTPTLAAGNAGRVATTSTSMTDNAPPTIAYVESTTAQESTTHTTPPTNQATSNDFPTYLIILITALLTAILLSPVIVVPMIVKVVRKYRTKHKDGASKEIHTSSARQMEAQDVAPTSSVYYSEIQPLDAFNNLDTISIEPRPHSPLYTEFDSSIDKKRVISNNYEMSGNPAYHTTTNDCQLPVSINYAYAPRDGEKVKYSMKDNPAYTILSRTK